MLRAARFTASAWCLLGLVGEVAEPPSESKLSESKCLAQIRAGLLFLNEAAGGSLKSPTPRREAGVPVRHYSTPESRSSRA
jgi:hypothetical protein